MTKAREVCGKRWIGFWQKPGSCKTKAREVYDKPGRCTAKAMEVYDKPGRCTAKAMEVQDESQGGL